MANLILRLCLLCLHSGESLGMSLANGDTKVVDSFSLFFLIRRFWQCLRRKLSMILYLLICDFFTAKQNCPRCRSRWENLDHAQYQPIKFMNSVFPSPVTNSAQPYLAMYKPRFFPLDLWPKRYLMSHESKGKNENP